MKLIQILSCKYSQLTNELNCTEIFYILKIFHFLNMRERLHFHIIGIANFWRSSWKPAKKNKSFYFKYNIQ